MRLEREDFFDAEIMEKSTSIMPGFHGITGWKNGKNKGKRT